MAITDITFLLTLLAMLLFTPAILIILGIYVYKDAKKRGMNKILWTIFSLITPSFLGFIIYLLVRKNYSDLVCGACGAPVSESANLDNVKLRKALIAVIVCYVLSYVLCTVLLLAFYVNK